jgi:arylsulfatase A-like enzyme
MREREGRSGGATRREFVSRGVRMAAAAMVLGALDGAATADARRRRIPRRATRRQPNVLVIVVDEMRTPVWFPARQALSRLLPNLSQLERGAVSFHGHFTASNDCTPARGTLVTGLYSQQTASLITGRSELDPGFPTWGTMMREHGYSTTWWGKWHLSHAATLEPWGFSGGTFPSPNGGPGQGLRADPLIASQFAEWFAAAGGDGPWCTTVSFVNPHDIVWWWRWTDRFAGERSAPPTFTTLPENFETPEQLVLRRKPRLQRSLQEVTDDGFGATPFTGPEARVAWCEQRDLYLELQRYVDVQIGVVLATLGTRPEIERDTIIVFTSDHGEYGGSHGLRGKGGGVYDEAIRVPLLVRDPRGELTRSAGVPRNQLTSSVDVAPLLLTIASGSSAWRRDPRYAPLAGRADLASICANPGAAGRPWVAHATDEVATEFCPQPYDASAPRHVIAVRTPRAKYAIYSDWKPGSFELLDANEDAELYDYATAEGRLELDNAAGHRAIEEPLRQLLLEHVLPNELRAPLPPELRAAQSAGRANYMLVSETVQDQAAADIAHRLADEHHPREGRGTTPSGPNWQPEPFPRRHRTWP